MERYVIEQNFKVMSKTNIFMRIVTFFLKKNHLFKIDLENYYNLYKKDEFNIYFTEIISLLNFCGRFKIAIPHQHS